MHLVIRKILISFGERFLGTAGPRLDVGVDWRIICFVRRINDDALCRRLLGRVSLEPQAIATATGTKGRRVASLSFEAVDVTHIWVSVQR